MLNSRVDVPKRNTWHPTRLPLWADIASAAKIPSSHHFRRMQLLRDKPHGHSYTIPIFYSHLNLH